MASSALTFFTKVIVIPHILTFQLVHNYGAAYGIFQHKRVFLLVVGVGIVLLTLLFQKRLIKSVWSLYGIVFLIAGALGNIVDRFRLGYVVDFIDIRIFPVFNVADVLIDIAIGLFIIDMIYDYKRSKRH